MNDLSKGYKQSIDQNWGRVVKIGFFGQKLRFRAQKKHTLLSPNHVPATTGKICSQKKSLKQFWVKMHFQPKKHFLDERKNGRFSVFLGHFFDGPAGSTKFC